MGEELIVDSGHVLAFSDTLTYRLTGQVRNSLFGDEHHYTVNLLFGNEHHYTVTVVSLVCSILYKC